MLAGVVLFAAYVLEERGLGQAMARNATRLTVLVLLPIHVACLLYTMGRWQQGLPEVGIRSLGNLDPFRGDWHPVVGSTVPLVVELTGLAVVGVLVWVLAARPGAVTPDDETDPPGDRPAEPADPAVRNAVVERSAHG
jgi:hypothetical protein